MILSQEGREKFVYSNDFRIIRNISDFSPRLVSRRSWPDPNLILDRIVSDRWAGRMEERREGGRGRVRSVALRGVKCCRNKARVRHATGQCLGHDFPWLLRLLTYSTRSRPWKRGFIELYFYREFSRCISCVDENKDLLILKFQISFLNCFNKYFVVTLYDVNFWKKIILFY